MSPKIYCDFTLKRTSGDGGYFSHSILNSFPEVPKRVEFLNKFYQCLLYGQLPHKSKKLVVCGANNSGKSSWARIFFGLMNRSKIVSVTKEKTFGLLWWGHRIDFYRRVVWKHPGDFQCKDAIPRLLDGQISQTLRCPNV